MHRSYGLQYSPSTQAAFQQELLRQRALHDYEREAERRRRRPLDEYNGGGYAASNVIEQHQPRRHSFDDSPPYTAGGPPPHTHNVRQQQQQQPPTHPFHAYNIPNGGDFMQHSGLTQQALPLTLNELMRRQTFATSMGMEPNKGGLYGARQPLLEDGPPLIGEPPLVIDPEQVVRNLSAVGRFLEMLQRWPLPRFSFTTSCVLFLVAIFISPRPCAQSILFPAFRLMFGVLHPAYASYKAVRTKHIKEYVKWMMYWIVFAFFTFFESFTDIFLSWLPFYYEVKVVIVLWLLSPATHGSSTLYRKFVHPALERREEEIDKYLNEAKERGYSAVLQLGSKGVNYATNVIMQTALKGGGNLVQTLKRSYSLSDLSEPDVHRTQDEIDQVVAIRPQQRILRPRLHTAVGRSASGTRHSTGMYFTEVDISKGAAGDINYNVRSSEDISSGYSSAEPLSGGLSRTSSMTNASRTRSKGKRPEEKHMSSSCTTLPRSKKVEKSVTPTMRRTK